MDTTYTNNRRCGTCGNTYDKAFSVVMDGTAHWFDSFECAIQALAPICPHCRCRIIGHGVESGDATYCCAHCGRMNGATQFKDRG